MLLVYIHNNVITVDENKSGIFHFYEIKMAKLHLPLEEEKHIKKKIGILTKENKDIFKSY